MNTILTEIDGTPYTFVQIGKRLKIKPASANARVKARQRATNTPLTWEVLEEIGHGFNYRKSLGPTYPCRNAIRREMSNQGWTYGRLAIATGYAHNTILRTVGAAGVNNRSPLTPAFVSAVAKALKLSKEKTHALHQLGARETGWKL